MSPDIITAFSGYGAMGLCMGYLMIKDWLTSKETRETIQANTQAMINFTVAIDTLKAVIK